MRIFLRIVIVEIHSQLKNHKKNKYRFYAKGYVLVGLKNNNTLHNMENPLHLKPAAQPDLKEKFKFKENMKFG